MPVSVLVVDDDAGFRHLAGRVLTGLGMLVVGEAATVAAALASAAELRPDAALVDVGLPDGDGSELAPQLADLPWRPRVLLISSDADAISPAEARRLGAEGFLPKAELPSAPLRRLLTGE